MSVTETDGIVIEGYEPGPVEVYGRRLKMEYVGMASVFVVIATLIYGGLPWLRNSPASVLERLGGHGKDDHQTDDHGLQKRRHAEQVQAVSEDADDQDTDDPAGV